MILRLIGDLIVKTRLDFTAVRAAHRGAHFGIVCYSKINDHQAKNFTKQLKLKIDRQNKLNANLQDLPKRISEQLDIKFDNKIVLDNTLNTISKTLSIFKPEELLLCFNGGKDSTVLVDLLHKFHKHLKQPKIQALYIESSDPFEEVNEFVRQCVEHYQLKLISYSGNQKLALECIRSELPNIRAVYMGCRRSDPLCQYYSAIMPTDNEWPSFLRILPLLEWSYQDIWNYLLSNQVPYCKLYDHGYTSLGEKYNTTTNQNLLTYSLERRKFYYRPAYDLKDGSKERANRDTEDSS